MGMARPRGFDETTVLRRARDRFWSTGFAGTSIDEVATATGLGKGSLYGAFGDKRQLYLRVFDRYCTEVTEATRRSLSGPDEKAYSRLRSHVLAVADATGRDIGHLGCLLANGTAELAGQDSAVAHRARRTFEALEDALVECIQRAQRHGDIDPDADARRHGRLLLAVLRGIEALGKANINEQSLRSIAEAALDTLPRP
ncbi:MAG: TetR family transcriptional regulator [Mycobacterium sp.]|jgi:TetR/AcrR family transcriptional repressor of nem operon|nr:TetR family transcriptional regulator [Mycobacterium sp.]